MSDLDWESQNIEGPPKILVLAEEWKDEQAIEDVKDNWDDEEEAEEEVKITETVPTQPIKHNQNNISSQPKAVKVKEETQKTKITAKKLLTIDEQLAEKLRLQKLAEDADYEIACEMFGLEGASKTLDNIDRLSTTSLVSSSTNAPQKGQTSLSSTFEAQSSAQADIESYIKSALREGCPSITLPVPSNNRQDYEKFAGALKGLLASIKDSPHFHYLAEEIIRYICFQISATDVKKLSIMMDTVSLEKLKNKQVDKKKKPVATGKGKKLPTLKKTSEQDYDNYMAPEHYDDYDDMF